MTNLLTGQHCIACSRRR